MCKWVTCPYIGGVVTNVVNVSIGGAVMSRVNVDIGGIVTSREDVSIGGVVTNGMNVSIGGVVTSRVYVYIGGVVTNGVNVDIGGVVTNGVNVDVHPYYCNIYLLMVLYQPRCKLKPYISTTNITAVYLEMLVNLETNVTVEHTEELSLKKLFIKFRSL